MAFWTGFANWLGFGRLANQDRGVQYPGPSSWSTEADIAVHDERAMGVSAVWACTRLIVNSGATLPLSMYTKDSMGDRQPLAENDPLVQVLHRRPNAWMNAKEFRMAMWTQRVLWGNAYARIVYRGDGRMTGLVPLRPGAVTPTREDDGMKYEYQTDSGIKTYRNRYGERAEMFHWRGFSSDGVIGMSPLAYARHALGISVSAERYASKAFNGRPQGVLSVPTFLTDVQRQQLHDRYSGSGQTPGTPPWWLLEGGIKWDDINLPPDDLQMLQSREFQIAEVCRYYGVPTVMVDGASSSTTWPASYEKQVLAFLTFTLKPYLEEFEDKVLETLAPENVYAEHNVEGFLRADSQGRAAYYSQAVQNGWMTRNEVRKKENLPAMDGGDELTIQVNMTPAESLGAEDQTGERDATQ